MAFSSVNPALARALAAKDYSVATEVQASVLATEGVGRDLLVSAQTGSGKTVAFGLAMATHLLGEAEQFERAGAPLALIIAPTRELAMQVQRELAWLYAETGARVATCVGGMDVRSEARALERGAHIVVGTPGRLKDHLERRRLDLSGLKAVVLDEADEMLDLGFREDLEFILDATPAERQTLLFSATMPRAIETMARQYQRDALRIETIRKGEQHADIEYQAIRVGAGEAEDAVVNVLRFHETRAALVFCATREGVKRMHLRLVERGFAAVALSGELTQSERTQALVSLKSGRARVLVATDVAARGLDLPDLALVIHADLPNDGETLLHRSGRTGRAGRKGVCVLIVAHHRRRKAEMLIGSARVRVRWAHAPSLADIRAKDQERFLADAIFTETPSRDDVAAAEVLKSARTPDEIALALVRMHHARLPSASELAPDRGPPPRREDRGEARGRDRDDRAPRERDRERRPSRMEREGGERDGVRGGDRGERAPRAPREDGRPMVWFRLNIGRERNADPRWVLPLICEAGDITKAEIGSIKIFDRDTRFQVVADRAEQFETSVKTRKQKQGHIARVTMPSRPDDAVVMNALKVIAGEPVDALESSDQSNDTVGHASGAVAPAIAETDGGQELNRAVERPKAPWRDKAKPKGRTYASDLAGGPAVADRNNERASERAGSQVRRDNDAVHGEVAGARDAGDRPAHKPKNKGGYKGASKPGFKSAGYKGAGDKGAGFKGAGFKGKSDGFSKSGGFKKPDGFKGKAGGFKKKRNTSAPA